MNRIESTLQIESRLSFHPPHCPQRDGILMNEDVERDEMICDDGDVVTCIGGDDDIYHDVWNVCCVPCVDCCIVWIASIDRNGGAMLLQSPNTKPNSMWKGREPRGRSSEFQKRYQISATT